MPQPNFDHSELCRIFKNKICEQTIIKAINIAQQNNAPLFLTLINNGFMSEADLIAALAKYFHIGIYQGNHLTATENLEANLPDIISNKHTFQASESGSSLRNLPTFSLIEPAFLCLDKLKMILSSPKNLACIFLLTDRKKFRETIENRYKNRLLHEAIYGLGERFPNCSAACLPSFHLSTGQNRFMSRYSLISIFALILSLIGLVSWFMPNSYTLAGLLLSPIFLAIIALRIGAIYHLLTTPDQHSPSQPDHTSITSLPIYTILVPLYKEARILPSLVNALQKLDYPKECLDIKLLMEQDDLETWQAAQRLNLPPYFDCMAIPASLPRTKPKALNYALHFAYGDYVVIYDAEDRPQPDQLLKAIRAFRTEADDIACIQARLSVYNASTNWLTRQFTLEYSTLFCAILPTLSAVNLPFLLGGTSNHFNLALLRKAGGWDAFNVTEDADLGIRLYRAGYRCTTICSTTYEESCIHFSGWLQQRTRWLKGWMQTYLVHMKTPKILWRDLTPRGFFCFQILLGGQILSALSYVLFILISVMALLSTYSSPDTPSQPSLAIGLIPLNIFMISYCVTGFLGLLALQRQSNQKLRSTVFWIPLYWIYISLASYRALYQLFAAPFYWEKTQHGHSLKINKQNESKNSQ